MRTLKLLLVGFLLSVPGLAMADASDVPGLATWYLHVDLKQMKSSDAGQAVYAWIDDEIFSDIKEDAGVDMANEVDRLTAYSLQEQGPVFVLEGDISQDTKDKVMTFIAASGDLQPQKSSGKSYYRLSLPDDGETDAEDGETDAEDGEAPTISTDNIEVELESLEQESWVSLDLKDRVIVTSSEEQMKELLGNAGKIPGKRAHNGALLVLTAEKALLQAGVNSAAMGDSDDGDSGWDSNILRNTEQVAFLVAAAKDKLAIEAKLITTEPEMAESLASVTRGLISLLSFDDEMDDELSSVLRGTKVEANGNALNISLAIAPSLVVSTLSD